ncbi:MAG: hypothetical protein F2817_15790 [Actinobacteria bacterium]|nr:hypothetical protein [Actinomycetota bacterium]
MPRPHRTRRRVLVASAVAVAAGAGLAGSTTATGAELLPGITIPGLPTVPTTPAPAPTPSPSPTVPGTPTPTPVEPETPIPGPGGLKAGACATRYVSTRDLTARQRLVATTPSGGMPDGVVTDPVFSRDSRANRFLAYTSTATNIAVPVQAGRRNVFMAIRGGRVSPNANPWSLGSNQIVSVGMGGTAADGDSWGAAIAGSTGRNDRAVTPKVLAFLSTATNLAPGGNPTGTSAFVRPVYGGAVRRLDVPGAATGVAVSGDSSVVYVSTDRGLYVQRGGRTRRLVGGPGITSPSTTLNGRQAAFERSGTIYTVTIDGRTRRIAAGSHPHADGGDPYPGRRGGYVRAISFVRDGGAWRAETIGGPVLLKRFGTTQSRSSTNGGGNAVAFGNGRHACLEVRLLDRTQRRGGYSIPQGACPVGQGTVSDVAVSTRYNYLAFTCTGGGLYLHYVGPK